MAEIGSHSHQCRAPGCRVTVANDVEFCAPHQAPIARLQAEVEAFTCDPAKAAEVERVARVIMAASEEASEDRLIVGAALSRAFAGFWARLAVDSGDGAEIAEAAVLDAACSVSELAGRLVDRHLGLPACRVCGCTDARACPEGCWWGEPDLCSSCSEVSA